MTRLLFFGRLRDIAGGGAREVDLPAHVQTLRELRDWIAGDDDGLRSALEGRGVRIAVDHVVCANDTPVGGAREIAFMPPLSGG